MSCATPGQRLSLSVPRFSHLQSGSDHTLQLCGRIQKDLWTAMTLNHLDRAEPLFQKTLSPHSVVNFTIFYKLPTVSDKACTRLFPFD